MRVCTVLRNIYLDEKASRLTCLFVFGGVMCENNPAFTGGSKTSEKNKTDGSKQDRLA